jgi:hypothetical protein
MSSVDEAVVEPSVAEVAEAATPVPSIFRPSDLRKEIEEYAKANNKTVDDIDPARYIKDFAKPTPLKRFLVSVRGKEDPPIQVDAVDEPSAIALLIEAQGIERDTIHKLQFDVVLVQD